MKNPKDEAFGFLEGVAVIPVERMVPILQTQKREDRAPVRSRVRTTVRFSALFLRF